MPQSELTFRAQLVIPEQRDVYDYWLSRCNGTTMPSRNDIGPEGLRKHLRCISLVDVEHEPRRYRVRLAGTELREVYGRELTGAYLDNDHYIDTSSLERLVMRCRPAQGVLPVRLKDRDHLIQFWLKLPLSEDGETVNMILGYDMFLHVPKAAALANQHVAKAS